ncbi:DUF937 domain-containing protein [Cellulophaga fucicola]|uniref:DUF937 domain-containing protein n=1 Tax=Cellulophaga fucicola TaxID=76595 RepID=A0A1K1MHR5_9FLAO|nr:DUF937 domain-containing protein [Cellulophaga fucicola]SFW22669.1 protein of unknown function [Cellulophaga fucicola]
MSGLLDLLNSPLGSQIIKGVAGQAGESEQKTAGVLSMALPLLMGAMKKNTATPEGAQGLMSALSGKHDGSILDNLGGLFGGGVDDNVMNDGQGILNHVLGAKQPQVENALSQKAGVSSDTVATILKIAAPLLMGVLGKQAKNEQVVESNGIGNLLGGLLGNDDNSNKEQSLIESFLDSDGDGSILDDVAGMVLGGDNKSGGSGIGGLLGGLFGK